MQLMSSGNSLERVKTSEVGLLAQSSSKTSAALDSSATNATSARVVFRIVDDALWQAVKDRQGELAAADINGHAARGTRNRRTPNRHARCLFRAGTGRPVLVHPARRDDA